jgi:hypothetical protein
MHDIEYTHAVLENIKQIGVSVSIDVDACIGLLDCYAKTLNKTIIS